jgi:hypothetical protein
MPPIDSGNLHGLLTPLVIIIAGILLISAVPYVYARATRE